MKKKWIKLALFAVSFINLPFSVSAAEDKDHIHFVLNNASYERVQARCGNFSYPGEWYEVGRTRSYKIRPEGLIWNPRKLQYTCSIYIPYTRVSSDIATFFPGAFDHSQPHSNVTLTIHSAQRGICVYGDAYPEQARVTYSLHVDGKVIKNRVEQCFFIMRPDHSN